jgi:hypothetical protein
MDEITCSSHKAKEDDPKRETEKERKTERQKESRQPMTRLGGRYDIGTKGLQPCIIHWMMDEIVSSPQSGQEHRKRERELEKRSCPPYL